ncbi:MAG: hypothetical protein VCA38_16410 [Roseibacillus sp.]
MRTVLALRRLDKTSASHFASPERSEGNPPSSTIFLFKEPSRDGGLFRFLDTFKVRRGTRTPAEGQAPL